MGVAACGDTRRLRARHDLSDIHVFSGNSPGMPYLPWVMSKFLTLGYSLEQVVTVAQWRQ
jgi:predicted amidohydrolase